MKEKIYSYIVLYFASMIPWVEQKAGTIAIASGMNIIEAFIVLMLSALTLVPLLIFFINNGVKLLKKIKCFKEPLEKFESNVMKHKDKIEKYEAFGLFIVVIIPSTGMWAASFLASLLKVKPSKAIIAIILGASCVSLLYLVGSAGFMKILDYIRVI